jgi:hypothetical protein
VLDMCLCLDRGRVDIVVRGLVDGGFVGLDVDECVGCRILISSLQCIKGRVCLRR